MAADCDGLAGVVAQAAERRHVARHLSQALAARQSIVEIGPLPSGIAVEIGDPAAGGHPRSRSIVGTDGQPERVGQGAHGVDRPAVGARVDRIEALPAR